MSDDEKLIRDLLAALQAKDALLACYRIGKWPSEALFRRLDKAKEAVKKATERVTGRQS